MHVPLAERRTGKGQLLRRGGSGSAEKLHVPAEGDTRKRRGERVLRFIGYRAARKGYPVKVGKKGQFIQKLFQRGVGAQHGALRVHRHGLAADGHKGGQRKRRTGGAQREQGFVVRAAGRVHAFQIGKTGKKRNVRERKRGDLQIFGVAGAAPAGERHVPENGFPGVLRGERLRLLHGDLAAAKIDHVRPAGDHPAGKNAVRGEKPCRGGNHRHERRSDPPYTGFAMLHLFYKFHGASI